MSIDRRLLLLLVTGLLGSQAAISLGVGSLFYIAAILVAGLHVARRSSEVMWVGFFLLAVTSQISPVQLDDLGTSLQGAYRPFIIVVVVVGASMLIGQFLRRGRRYSRHPSQSTSVRVRIGAFVAVLFLTLGNGYFGSMRGHGLLDILRECSGWITFLVFLFLGSRLATSTTEAQIAFARFRLAVLVYSVFFVIKFIFLSLSSSVDEAAVGFGYSQRDVIFFSGLALIFLVVQSLTSGITAAWKENCGVGLILLLATLLSGSRSALACVLVTTLLFALVLHSNARLRFGLLGMVAVLVVLFGPILVSSSRDGILGYISNRYLILSVEDTSLLAHASEMIAVADAVRENPLLGKGPLASYAFFDPLFGWKETTYLDSGIGYLLMKTGLLGTCIFIWFAVGWFKMMLSLRKMFPVLVHICLATFVYYLVFLLFGPSFFAFQHAWLIGLVVGHTVALASKLPVVRSPQISGAIDQSGALV